MQIALLGYGKMGKEIERVALERDHTIFVTIDVDQNDFAADQLNNCDVAIEFSTPESAVTNIRKCFEANVPVVVGTTGWYDEFDAISKQCEEKGQALFHATNFSIGVNMFFKLNRWFAEKLRNYPQYEPDMVEIHHTEKLDAPSGTAISLANDLLEASTIKEKWVNNETDIANELQIISKREAEVKGTHTITWRSDIDDIQMTHQAHSRKGFALGAVMAAEWIQGKQGVFTMNDMLHL